MRHHHHHHLHEHDHEFDHHEAHRHGEFDHMGGFGPGFGRGPRRGRRGLVRIALLRELIDGPQHGYQLIQRIEERTGGWYRPSPGSVYPTLQLLEDRGDVVKHEQDGKAVYELTDQGRAEAAQAAQKFEKLGEAFDRHFPSEQAADLGRAVQGLAGAVHQVMHVGSDEQVTAALEIVGDARKRLYALLAQ